MTDSDRIKKLEDDLNHVNRMLQMMSEAYDELLKEHKTLRKEKQMDFSAKTLNPKYGDVLILTATRRFPKYFSAKSIAEDIQEWCTKLGVEIAPWFVFLEKGMDINTMPKEQLIELADKLRSEAVGKQ